jgi:hypothetical protein
MVHTQTLGGDMAPEELAVFVEVPVAAFICWADDKKWLYSLISAGLGDDTFQMLDEHRLDGIHSITNDASTDLLFASYAA